MDNSQRKFEEIFNKHKKLTFDKISPQTLNEIFVLNKETEFKKNLIEFLKLEFQKHDIRAVHGGISATEFKSEDWVEPIATFLINKLVEYFETVRG